MSLLVINCTIIIKLYCFFINISYYIIPVAIVFIYIYIRVYNFIPFVYDNNKINNKYIYNIYFIVWIADFLLNLPE